MTQRRQSQSMGVLDQAADIAYLFNRKLADWLIKGHIKNTDSISKRRHKKVTQHAGDNIIQIVRKLPYWQL